MSIKKVTPEIRFKGFDKEWAEKKLGDTATFSKGQGYSKKDLTGDGTPVILYGRLYTNYKTSIIDVNTFAIEQPKSIYSKGTEVIVPSSGETAEDIARASSIEKSGFLIGGDLNIIYPHKCLNQRFLALSISHGQQQKQLASKAQGKSVVHLSNSDLKEFELLIPYEYGEQSQIGELFKQLDELIINKQKKYNKLQTIKKSMLKTMFPKNGATTPLLRFKGFDEKWRSCELKNISKIIGGGTPSTCNPNYWNGDIDWYTPAEINGSIYTTGSKRKITETGLKNSSAQILPAYKTILFTSRAGIGKTAILSYSGTTNQGFQSIVLNDEYNPYFIYSISNQITKKAEAISSGSTFLEISGTVLGTLTIMIPEKSEQDKVAQLFKQLDHLITLQQQELDTLNNIKKALLEKMFV